MESTVEARQAISALRSAYAAFNRGDMDAAVQPLDAEIEWTEPAEFPGGGTYHGREAAKHYLTQSRAAWAEVSSEPERFITARQPDRRICSRESSSEGQQRMARCAPCRRLYIS